MVKGASQGGGRGRGSATRGGGRGRGSATHGGGRGRGRPPSSNPGGGCGRGRSPSAARGGGRGRGSATRGGGRGRGRPPSSNPVRGRARGRPPSASRGVGRGRGGRGRGKSSDAPRGGGRGQGRPLKTVKKKIPVKPSKSKEVNDCEEKNEVVKTGSTATVAIILDVSQECTSITAAQDSKIPSNESALISQVEDAGINDAAVINDAAFLQNKAGISSSSATDIQDHKAPVSPNPSAVDFHHNRFMNPSCTDPRVLNSKLRVTGTHQIQTNAPHGTIQVSNVQDVSNNNAMVSILKENKAAASQIDDIETSKVFKAPTIHVRKKSPYVCLICSKHILRKDHFLTHNMVHTKERLRHVKPKRQHLKKSVSISLSDPASVVGPSSAKEGNLPENEKDQVDTTSEQENFPHGNNVDILCDKMDMGTKDKHDNTIDLSDEDMSTQRIPEGDSITSPTFLATSDATSASKTVSKVNHVQMVTIDLTLDDEPANSKELKCTKKVVKKRLFPHQPLRQNQIPNGGFEITPAPVNHDLPMLNIVKELGVISRISCGEGVNSRISCGEGVNSRISCGEGVNSMSSCGEGVNSRSSCGEALDKLKLLGPSVTLTRATPSTEETANRLSNSSW